MNQDKRYQCLEKWKKYATTEKTSEKGNEKIYASTKYLSPTNTKKII